MAREGERGGRGEGEGGKTIGVGGFPYPAGKCKSGSLLPGNGRRWEVDRSRSHITSPHTLPPSTILAAHLAPYLAQQQADLDTRIQATEAQNVVLTDTIGAQHEEIHRLLGQLQGLVGDLNGAADALDGVVRPDDFPREIERMNDEMTPANARMKELSSG